MSSNDRQDMVLAMLSPLTEQQRADAADSADAAVGRIIGKRPTPQQFSNIEISEYPNWFSGTVALLVFIVMAAASLVSIFRVFTSARDSYLATINDPTQAWIVGAAVFIMAEAAAVISVLAARIFYKGQRTRYVFWAIAGIAASIAIVGNAQITRPPMIASLDAVWVWLETLAPPIFVMGTAMVGESLVADAIKTRHASEVAFKAALLDWQDEIADVRNHVAWRTKYRSALREAIRAHNLTGRGKTEREAFMATMGPADWTVAVLREEMADLWYLEDMASFTEPQAAPNLEASQSARTPLVRPLLPTPANQHNNQKPE